jgi:hypothetical protein
MWKLIDYLKQRWIIKLSVIYLRYLIGFAFVFASIVKIKGERFTSIPATEPVGYFFEAMYQSGFYWNFLGWAQFISGALLMSQRFSTIGAIVFFPVILNVCLITNSIDFGSGTPMITTLMLLGTMFLLLWDYKKWIILFYYDHHIKLDLTNQPKDRFMTDPVWTVAGVTFVLLTVAVQINKPSRAFILGWLIVMVLVGLVAMTAGLMRYFKRNAKGMIGEKIGQMQ